VIKVTFVTHSLSRLGGGIVPVVQSLANELSQSQSLEVSIHGFHDPLIEQDRPGWGRLPITAHRLSWPESIGKAPNLANGIANDSPDLIHSHGLWKLSSADVFRRHLSTGTPYVVSPHGMLEEWALKNSKWKKRLAYLMFEKQHLANASCLHALCKAEAESIRRLGFSGPICIIPNGVYISSDLHNTKPLSESPPSVDRRPYILFLGRLHRKKGLIPLIQAWKKLVDSGQRWDLIVAGWDDGGFESEIQRRISSLGLSDSVHLVGAVFGEEKQRMYLQADGFILPSYSEGLPMTVLEAWSNKVPVLMTEECNLGQAFGLGAALQLDANVDSIYQTLSHFVRLTEFQRNEIGDRGRLLVEQEFQWPIVASKFRQVYDWILGRSTCPQHVEIY